MKKSRGVFVYGLDEDTVDRLRSVALNVGLFVRRGTNTDGGNLAAVLQLIARTDSDQLEHLLRQELSRHEIANLNKGR